MSSHVGLHRLAYLTALTGLFAAGCACGEHRLHERASIIHENLGTLLAPAEPPPPPHPRFHAVPTRPVFSPRD